MRSWKPVLIPLDRGLSQESAQTGDGVTFNRAVNLDFGKKGAVRGRPGYLRATGGFWLAGQNNSVPTQTSVATLAATGYTAVEPFAITDKRSERVGLLTNGRIFSYEGDAWVDRFGAGAMRVDRVADYQFGLAGGLPATFNPPAAGHDFGPGVYDQQTRLLSSEGVRDAVVAGPVQGPGSSAVSGTTTATVHVAAGTNNLIFTWRVAGARTISTSTLLTDAATPQGFGDNPVICSDMGLSGFYVAYRTTTAHTVRVLQLSLTGSINSAVLITYGTGTITGLWICNSATPYVVLALVDSATTGVKTKIFNSILIDQTLDATLFAGLQCWGPVTCGATVETLGGGVFVTTLGNDGSFRVSKRAITSAITAGYGSWSGTFYGPTGSAATQGHAWFLQHQPVWVNGRALAGVAAIRAWNNVQGGSQTATWYTVDLTDLLSPGSTAGSRRTPPMVARGVLDGSLIPWNPVTATVNADGNGYRFSTIDWTRFSAGTPGSTLGPVTLSAIVGYDGVLGTNEVSCITPQVDHVGDTTVIGGSIPRGLAGGAAYELGFPWLGFPACTAAPSSTGGSWAAGNYTVKACWRWTDDAGQVHRSAASVAYNIAVSAGQKITFFGSPLQFTDKNLMSPGDRGGVYIEFYMTSVNPTGNAPHYLVATIGGNGGQGETGSMQSTGLLSGPVDTSQTPLYTDVALANLPVSADGGVITVGRRCWVSDGDFLYASKLGLDGDPPAWNGDQDARAGGADGPLSVAIPASAGRILSLGRIDERVVALCERGVYVMAGDGPDDTGANSDYTAPLQVSALGVAGGVAACSTPRGVVFQAAHPQLSESVHGGLWMVDKSLEIVQVSWPAREAVDTTAAGQLVFLPERALVVFLTPAVPGNPAYVGGGNTGAQLSLTLPYLVVWDLHVNTWTIWTAPPDGLTGITSVAGYLWSAGTDVGGFTGLPGIGHDTVNGVNTNFTMELQTNDLAASGDGLGWSRVRSLRVLGDAVTTDHNLTMAYTQDDAVATNTVLNASKTQALTAAAQLTGWPSDRYAPEWRVPNSKCSTIRVDLQATPASAVWTHLELQVKPERRAPAHYAA